VDLADFDYDLPPGAIAQAPAPERDGARLLVIDRGRQSFADHGFADLPGLLRPGDCLVVNESRVIPARVLAQDAEGRPVELLFLEPLAPERWRALVRPGRRCPPGTPLRAGEAALRIVATEPDGVRVVERADGTIADLMARRGLTPLPPYVRRFAGPTASDAERYQTVYARPPGSVAAPTAGLHFTPTLLEQIRARGVEIHALTLHVGAGTFRPIATARVEDHRLPPERVSVPPGVADAVTRARASGRRVVAVGTTTTRALESAVGAEGRVAPLDGVAGAYIMPGHRFGAVDALVTNFHLPRSSLLVLVSAFAGRELILKAYAHALRAGYRFYSFGDATLVL
jgi:S-adenosylmethionine:tRNA ribosyltransferase-isomerase